MKAVWHEVILDCLPLLLHPARRAYLMNDLQNTPKSKMTLKPRKAPIPRS